MQQPILRVPGSYRRWWRIPRNHSTVEEGNNIDGYHPTTVKDFEDSQIELSVKMWVDEPRPMAIDRAQTTVFAELRRRFADEQISIPFPQRTSSERETVPESVPEHTH